MALARPQMGGGATGLKATLIVFVCLTVASWAFTVILYTGQEDLRASAEAATSKAKRAGQNERELRQQLSQIARDVIGDPTDEPAKIQQAIKTSMTPIVTDERVQEANIPADSAVLTVLKGVHEALQTQAGNLAAMTQERDELSGKLEAQTQAVKDTEEQFVAKTQELGDRVEQLAQQSAKDYQEWDLQVQKLTEDLETSSQDASKQLNAQRDLVQKQGKKLAQQQARIDELVQTLASFRPSADRTSLLQITDGNVVEAVAGQDIVYIDLGKKDAIKPGMTFAVYSRIRGIPADGKGKASLEVVNVFAETSECRATMTTPGDPVLRGDVVANPVYDRTRKLTFAVAGDFDLDFDGIIDDPGGDQVVQMIANWGGQVVDKIDTRTDFIVLGAQPVSAEPPEGTEEVAAEPQRSTEELKAAQKAFDIAKTEARALSIPVLTRTQFLHFVGFGIANNVPDDPSSL